MYYSTPHGTLPMTPGHPEWQDYEYARQGACSLFLAVVLLTGQRREHVTERRIVSDCAEQLRILVEEEYPDVEKVMLVTNNPNTHAPAAL